MNLDLLFLTQTFPRFPDDTAGPFIRDIARGLVRLGDRVTILTPHADGVEERWTVDGVEIESFRYAPESLEVLGYSRSLEKDETIKIGAGLATPLYVLGARRAIARKLKQQRFDLLQAHWVVPNLLVAKPFWQKIPLATGLHGSDVFLAERPLVRQLTRRALERSVLVTGCSPELVDRVCAVGFPREEARVIPYGVDGEAFQPGPDEHGRWREVLGIPNDAFVLLSVGRMATKKGFHVLLEIVPELLEKFSSLHIVLAGSGDRLQEFQERTASVRDRMHFPGAVLRDTLPDLYRTADAFVLPAVHDAKGNVDGLPNVILEAMATGLPVVASGISGIPQAVIDRRNGRLVPEQEPRALFDALVDVIGDPERALQMGATGRFKAVQELSWDAVAKQYHDAYVGALERRGTPPHFP